MSCEVSVASLPNCFLRLVDFFSDENSIADFFFFFFLIPLLYLFLVKLFDDLVLLFLLGGQKFQVLFP